MGSRRPLLAAVPLIFLFAGPPAQAALPDHFTDERVVEGLNQPSSLDILPDGRILVVEQRTGAVRLVVQGALVGSPILTVSGLNTSGGERGLLGIAVDAFWPIEPYIYLLYTHTPGNTTYISRFTASGDLADSASTNLSLGSRYDILTDIPDNAPIHNGGTLRSGADRTLYASLGDDSATCTAQDSSDFRGVILRLTVAALPDTGTGPPDKALITPPDNPFPDTDPEAGLAFCFGLRNPFRFHIDPETEALYIGDVGQGTFEEIDEATGGENFGWPFREGPNVRTQMGCTEPGGTGASTYDDPIAYYDRTGFIAAIIGGPVYHPVPGGEYSFPPEYDGALFFSDYYEGFIRVVKRNAGVWEPLPPVPGQPNATDWGTETDFVADYRIGPDGAIYYVRQQEPASLRRILYKETVTAIPDDPRPDSGSLRLSTNPFRPAQGSLELTLAGGSPGPVTVEIFSFRGTRLRTLLERPVEGSTTVVWDGRDASGRPVPAGVYLIRAVGAGSPAGQRVVVLR